MKKICAVIFLLLIGCGAWLLLNYKEPFQLPVSAGQVESISIYSIIEKKTAASQADIAAVMDAMTCAYSKGPYERGRFPAGGLSFCILFHLSGGESLPCLYYQTAEASGFYTDGEARIFLTGLDLRAVWEALECESVRASAEEEFSDWPEL